MSSTRGASTCAGGRSSAPTSTTAERSAPSTSATPTATWWRSPRGGPASGPAPAESDRSASGADGPLAERERVGGHVDQVASQAAGQRAPLALGHRSDRLRLGHRDRRQEPPAACPP